MVLSLMDTMRTAVATRNEKVLLSLAELIGTVDAAYHDFPLEQLIDTIVDMCTQPRAMWELSMKRPVTPEPHESRKPWRRNHIKSKESCPVVPGRFDTPVEVTDARNTFCQTPLKNWSNVAEQVRRREVDWPLLAGPHGSTRRRPRVVVFR
jgi:hypothetical protein